MGMLDALAGARTQARMYDRYRQHNEALRDHDIARASQLLGLPSGAEPAEIRAAFATKVKAAHPDSGGTGGDIQQLKQARNILLEAHRLPKEHVAAMHPCQMCSGRGMVSEGFGYQVCTTCNGTGVVA